MRTYIVLAVLVCATAIFEQSNGATCNAAECIVEVLPLIPKDPDNLTEEDCKKVNDAVKCGNDIKKGNCDDTQKAEVDITLNKYTDGINKCKGDGVAGLASSLVLCLAMTGVAYLLTSLK